MTPARSALWLSLLAASCDGRPTLFIEDLPPSKLPMCTDVQLPKVSEAGEVTDAIRSELGRESEVSVVPSATRDEWAVTVKYRDPPAEPARRNELVLATNVIVRRVVHKVREVNVPFDDLPSPAANPVVVPRAKTGTVTTGRLTLVTFPEADAFRGRQKLGRTPLFNTELPAGTHLLTLLGADGSPHQLSVVVRAGKNTSLKMDLKDVPAR